MANSASRVALKSARRNIDNPRELTFKDPYSPIGANTGNLVFTNAVFEHINAHIKRVVVFFNHAAVNRHFDFVVNPVANWIKASTDWDFLVDTLEQVKSCVRTIVQKWIKVGVVGGRATPTSVTKG